MAFNSTPKNINEQNINGLLSCYDEWERVELSNIAKIVNGFAFKSAEFNSNGEGNRLIRIRDVLKGDTQTYFSGEVPDGYWVTSDDIIIGMDGDFNIAWWTGEPGLLNQRVCKIDELTELFDKRLLFRLLPGYLEAINANTSSTTVKHLSSKTLEGLLLPLPPLAEQKVIADKLETLLAQVGTIKAHLECIPDILKTFRQSVLTAATSGKLTEEWRKVTLAQWKELKLHDVIQGKPRNGHSPKGVGYETPYRNLTLSATTSGKFVENQYKYIDLDIDSESYLWVKHGDILIQRANTIDYVGVSAIYEGEDNQYVYPDLMMKCRPNTEKVLGRYLYLALSSQKVRKYFRDNATGTSGNMPKINQQVVSNAPISLPPLDEQQEIVHRVEEFFTFANHIAQQVNSALARINNLTQSILAKAFRGELTADWRAANPEFISGDNSAKALLEKIEAERKAIEKQPKPKRSAIKKKTSTHMSKQIMKVVEALKQAGEPLSGQQLLAAAGYPSDSSTDQLEQFFLDLRDALTIEKSIVKLERGDDSQDWFALATPSINKVKD